jgi:hypothetical protein
LHTLFDDGVYVAQVTIRRVEEAWVEKAKLEAARLKVPSQLGQRALGDAEFFQSLDLVEQLEGIGFPAEEVLVSADGFPGVFGFVEQLDSEPGKSSAAEVLEVARTRLRLAIEERIATADIGLEAVELADSVAKMDDVFFARTSAVFVGRATAEEGAKHAVLHVKHRHVLVESQLEPLGRSAVQKF